jgi:hypothetical protein
MNRRRSALAIGSIAVILALPIARTHPTAASADAEVAAQFEAAASSTPPLRTNSWPSKYIYGYCLA